MDIKFPKKDFLLNTFIKIVGFIADYVHGIAFILISLTFMLQAIIFFPMLWTIAPTEHILGFNITLLVGYIFILSLIHKEGEKQMYELRDVIYQKLKKLIDKKQEHR